MKSVKFTDGTTSMNVPSDVIEVRFKADGQTLGNICFSVTIQVFCVTISGQYFNGKMWVNLPVVSFANLNVRGHF